MRWYLSTQATKGLVLDYTLERLGRKNLFIMVHVATGAIGAALA